MQEKTDNRQSDLADAMNQKSDKRAGIREMHLWKKVLVFLQQEHLYQKNKLVEILKNNNNNQKADDILEIAEVYQNKFLQQDETFRLMWNDLAKFEKSLTETNGTPGTHEKDIPHLQKKLRREVEIVDANFYELKTDFNKFFDFFFTENYTETRLGAGKITE